MILFPVPSCLHAANSGPLTLSSWSAAHKVALVGLSVLTFPANFLAAGAGAVSYLVFRVYVVRHLGEGPLRHTANENLCDHEANVVSLVYRIMPIMLAIMLFPSLVGFAPVAGYVGYKVAETAGVVYTALYDPTYQPSADGVNPPFAATGVSTSSPQNLHFSLFGIAVYGPCNMQLDTTVNASPGTPPGGPHAMGGASAMGGPPCLGAAPTVAIPATDLGQVVTSLLRGCPGVRRFFGPPLAITPSDAAV